MGPAPVDENPLNVTFNREQRRKRKPTNPDFTKATWSRQTKSELKRKRKLGRK